MKTHITASKTGKKVFSSFFLLLVFYVTPLYGKIELLIHWKVIALALIATFLITHSRLGIIELNKIGRSTSQFVVILSGVVQIISLLEWAYFWENGTGIQLWTYIGIALLIVGTLVQLHTTKTSGCYFLSNVNRYKIDIKLRSSNQPSMGVCIILLGASFFLASIAGLIVSGLATLLFYQLQVNTDSKTQGSGQPRKIPLNVKSSTFAKQGYQNLKPSILITSPC